MTYIDFKLQTIQVYQWLEIEKRISVNQKSSILPCYVCYVASTSNKYQIFSEISSYMLILLTFNVHSSYYVSMLLWDRCFKFRLYSLTSHITKLETKDYGRTMSSSLTRHRSFQCIFYVLWSYEIKCLECEQSTDIILYVDFSSF